MFKNISSIIKDSIGNIIYRGNVVTGTVAIVRGDGSYDVFISESDKAYPKIFTLSRNPDLTVGDKVRILYKNGCKELPIILPPVVTAAPTITYNIAYVYYYGSTNYLVILDSNGNIIYNAVHSAISYTTDQDAEAVDNNGNIYITGRWADKFKKLDNNGNLLTEISVTNPFQIAINSSGEIWLYEWTDDNYFVKRDPTTLAKLDEIVLNNSYDYMGMTFDSSGYLYVVNWVTEKIEKWNVVSKTKIAERTTGLGNDSIYCSLAVIGSNVYMVNSGNRDADYWVIPTSLGSNFVGHDLTEFGALDDVNFITGYGGTHFVVEGFIGSVKHILKYDSNGILVWDTPIVVTGSGLGVAAYPF